ncbi:MAG: hypothetical protein VX397_00005 [Pseudomonadota bacterium]|nr:hypothetical protein [Pseudomonadota bacterium]
MKYFIKFYSFFVNDEGKTTWKGAFVLLAFLVWGAVYVVWLERDNTWQEGIDEIKEFASMIVWAVESELPKSLGLSNPNVNRIKSSTLSSCPNKTLETMINGFMAYPIWTSGESEEGNIFVNVNGGIIFQEKEVDAALQFSINKDNFRVRALEFNEIPQNRLIITSLLIKMCEAQ